MILLHLRSKGCIATYSTTQEPAAEVTEQIPPVGPASLDCLNRTSGQQLATRARVLILGAGGSGDQWQRRLGLSHFQPCTFRRCATCASHTGLKHPYEIRRVLETQKKIQIWGNQENWFNSQLWRRGATNQAHGKRCQMPLISMFSVSVDWLISVAYPLADSGNQTLLQR